MKFIEEHIRRLLGREEPPALDTDDLWAGIAAGLPAETDTPAATAPRRYRGWLGLALLVVIGAGLGYWWTMPEESFAQVNTITEKTRVDGAGGEGVRPTSAASNPIGATNEHAANTGPNTVGKGLPGSELVVPSQRSQGIAPDSFAESRNPRSTNVQPIAEQELTGTTTPSTPAPIPVPAPAAAPRNVATAVSLLPTITLNRIATNRELPTPTVEPTKFVAATQPRLSVGLHGGTNALLSNFTIIPEGPVNALNRATKTALGQSLALDLRYRLNDRLAVTLGAEYHRTLNTFRHTERWDTVVVHPTEPNTRLIAATALQTVAHNNRSSIISVPLTLSYHQPVGAFTVGLGAGFSGNFLLRNSGRTLDATGNFARYDEVADKSLFLGYHLRPELSYRLNDRWTLEGRLDVRRYGVRAAAVPGIEERQGMILGAVGLRWVIR